MATSNKSTAKRSSSKKSSLKKSHGSTGDGPACWPGFQRVPGTNAGAKGSCEPNPHATADQKKADSRAAAARKLEQA